MCTLRWWIHTEIRTRIDEPRPLRVSPQIKIKARRRSRRRAFLVSTFKMILAPIGRDRLRVRLELAWALADFEDPNLAHLLGVYYQNTVLLRSHRIEHPAAIPSRGAPKGHPSLNGADFPPSAGVKYSKFARGRGSGAEIRGSAVIEIKAFFRKPAASNLRAGRSMLRRTLHLRRGRRRSRIRRGRRRSILICSTGPGIFRIGRRRGVRVRSWLQREVHAAL
jgi:hypothetical protein